MEIRACSSCGVLFPRTSEFFYKRPRSADGLRGQCKTCLKRKAIPRKKANRDKTSAWQKANPDKTRAIRKKAKTKYRSDPAHKDEIKAKQFAKRLADPLTACAEGLRRGVSERSRDAGFYLEPAMNTVAFYRDLLRSQPKCPCCGEAFLVRSGHKKPGPLSPTIDRLDIQIPSYYKNFALICFQCNTIKSDATPAKLRRVADWQEYSMAHEVDRVFHNLRAELRGAL